jgi:hypothetical protein
MGYDYDDMDDRSDFADPRWNGEGRSLCIHCGHDGDG